MTPDAGVWGAWSDIEAFSISFGTLLNIGGEIGPDRTHRKGERKRRIWHVVWSVSVRKWPNCQLAGMTLLHRSSAFEGTSPALAPCQFRLKFLNQLIELRMRLKAVRSTVENELPAAASYLSTARLDGIKTYLLNISNDGLRH